MNGVKKHILLVDDEERLLNSMAQRISLLGFAPIKASSGIQALEIAKTTRIDLAIVDLKMPDMDGLVTITKLKEMLPDLKTVLLTGYGSEKTRQTTEALGAMYFEKDAMAGLWDVIKKSGKDGNVFVINPSSSGAGIPLETESAETDKQNFSRIIGETPEMQRLIKNIRRLSGLDCTIIIYGEIGTGKELAARTIHQLGHRKNQRFLAFDCGCFSNDFRFRELVASLGPQSGDNNEMQTGFAGTILLDHIENMPSHTQQDMIQILNRKQSGPVSDGAVPPMDVRFIVATQENLETKVSQGRFNRDLYQKIQGIELEIPALRDRNEDVPILCRYFINRFNQTFQKQITSISDAVSAIFDTYAFPGNVRELRHIIERAVILADSEVIEPRHLPRRLTPAGIPEPADKNQPFLTLHKMEQQHILTALKITGGNKTKAAEILGISRAALWRKLRIISQQEA